MVISWEQSSGDLKVENQGKSSRGEVLTIRALAFGGESMCQRQLSLGSHSNSDWWCRTRGHYGRSSMTLGEVSQVPPNSWSQNQLMAQ